MNLKRIFSKDLFVVALFVAILTILGGVGSAIVFFIPVLNIDSIITLSQTAVQSLFIK